MSTLLSETLPFIAFCFHCVHGTENGHREFICDEQGPETEASPTQTVRVLLPPLQVKTSSRKTSWASAGSAKAVPSRLTRNISPKTWRGAVPSILVPVPSKARPATTSAVTLTRLTLTTAAGSSWTLLSQGSGWDREAGTLAFHRDIETELLAGRSLTSTVASTDHPNSGAPGVWTGAGGGATKASRSRCRLSRRPGTRTVASSTRAS